MAVDTETYMKTLAWATAVLTLKLMINHLLVVRVRVSEAHLKTVTTNQSLRKKLLTLFLRSSPTLDGWPSGGEVRRSTNHS